MSLFPRIFGNRFEASHIDPEDVFLDSTNKSELNIHQMEGHLEKPLSPLISTLMICCIVLVMIGFGSRLYSMQIVNAATYQDLATNNHIRSIPLFAHRGTILDKNGSLLAWNEVDKTNGTVEIPRRAYISTPGFSHVLGYVSYPKKDSSGIFWQEEYIGKDGVEKQYQTRLQGVPGERLVAVSARQEIQGENVTIWPKDGDNITLTIDSKVQAKLYSSIRDLANRVGFRGGAGVIMDVRTGDILALTSYPEYDNNLMANATTPEDQAQLTKDLQNKNNKFLNRVTSGLFTPGSTVKPFIGYAALTEGVITPEKQILSTGALVVKNKYGGPDTIFRDWKVHGYVDMRQAIAQSSDEYFYQVGGGFGSQSGLGIARIDEYARKFGFGSTTGIDLPGEVSGLIPTPEWKKKVFGEEWLVGNTYHTSIGQYGFQLTPLELLRAVASLANGGHLLTPRIVASSSPVVSKSLSLDQENLKVIQEGMRRTVLGQTAQVLDISGVSVAAKSGTAELGVDKQLVNSWISGYFPYENPRYAFVVIMEKGSRNNLTGAVFAMRETLEWMRDNTEYTK